MYRTIRKWARDRNGATAIEFSLVAAPFFFLLMGIVEMALMFATSSLVQGSVSDAARLIRTGQVQQAQGIDPEDMFRDALCNHAQSFIACQDLLFEVIPLDEGFTQAGDLDPVFDEDGNPVLRGFDPGGVNDVVLIRVFYRYPLVTPIMAHMLSNGPNNTRLILSTAVFQTEPYDFDDTEGGA